MCVVESELTDLQPLLDKASLAADRLQQAKTLAEYKVAVELLQENLQILSRQLDSDFTEKQRSLRIRLEAINRQANTHLANIVVAQAHLNRAAAALEAAAMTKGLERLAHLELAQRELKEVTPNDFVSAQLLQLRGELIALKEPVLPPQASHDIQNHQDRLEETINPNASTVSPRNTPSEGSTFGSSEMNLQPLF